MESTSNTLPFPSKSARIYRLRVVLEDTKPEIYRVLLVRGDIGLDLLHAILQIAMGWTNSHLHKFVIGRDVYSAPEPEMDGMPLIGGEPEKDEAGVSLEEVAKKKGFQFGYEYDFGDCWEHRIRVEDVIPDDGSFVGFAQCIDGKRACPPEDCGGVWGYADLLKTISDPKHEGYESMMEWLGGAIDPDAFDSEKVNLFLGKLKGKHPTVDQLGRLLMAQDKMRQEKEKPPAKEKSNKKKAGR